MNIYKTDNFNIQYKKDEKKNIQIEIELLRNYYYNNLVRLFIKKCDENNIVVNKENSKKNKVKLREIFSYFILNNTDYSEHVLNTNIKFDINIIETIMGKNIKDKNIEKELKEVLKICKNKMKIYFDKFVIYKNKLVNKNIIDVSVRRKKDLIIYNLKQKEDLPFRSKKYGKLIKQQFSIHISLYTHLLKLYSIKNYNIYSVDKIDEKTGFNPAKLLEFNEDDNTDWIKKFHEKIYILLLRYHYISSGSTQASIKPAFKKILREALNIKIELFASGINSSFMTYCSVFYDIESFFGSIGSFFNTKILSGYYEINPPFEINIINKIFKKIADELIRAEKDKQNLLFFIVIPKFNLSNIIYFSKMQQFLKFKKLVDKSQFPYVYYNQHYTYAITKNIIDTYILIYHTSYIKNAVKKNVTHFNNYLKKY